MDLSIILPTYNEKGNIVVLINKLINIIPKNLKKEIIIVDDNSKDNTYLYCKNEFKDNNEVKVILRESSRSLGKSIGDGIEISSGKILIVMDTDLSHNPEHIPTMLDLVKNYEIISCSRYSGGGSMENKPHFFVSYLYNILLRIILNTKVKDNTGGYFCIKKTFLNSLPHESIFYGYGEYFFRLLYFAKINGGNVKELPTKYQDRTYGKSKSNFLYMIFKYLISAIKLRLKIY